MDLIVCDGDENKMNRLNLFNPNYNYVGVYTTPHKERKTMTCLVFCGYLAKDGEENLLEAQM